MPVLNISDSQIRFLFSHFTHCRHLYTRCCVADIYGSEALERLGDPLKQS